MEAPLIELGSAGETPREQNAEMADDKKKCNGTQAPASSPFGHLLPGPDLRTPEERQAAQTAEYNRRKGRGRKDWWKKYLEDGKLKKDD